jgi:hypothetical protein
MRKKLNVSKRKHGQSAVMTKVLDLVDSALPATKEVGLNAQSSNVLNVAAIQRLARKHPGLFAFVEHPNLLKECENTL